MFIDHKAMLGVDDPQTNRAVPACLEAFRIAITSEKNTFNLAFTTIKYFSTSEQPFLGPLEFAWRSQLKLHMFSGDI